MRKFLSTVAISGLLLGAAAITAPTATAAPITCPEGQKVVKLPGGGGWDCQNKPVKGDPNSEDPKNPNAGKDKF
jgi:hypothetical protein